MTITETDVRFRSPLYTIGEAADIVSVPAATLVTWARGYERHFPGGRVAKGDPVVTDYGPASRHVPTMPFVGLAEAAFLAAIKRTGVPLQRIRPALAILRDDLGIEHALASDRLLSDGNEVLYSFAERVRSETGDYLLGELMVVRNRQGVFTGVVADYLNNVTWERGYVKAMRLRRYRSAEVTVDPDIAFGAPILATSGARVSDILERYRGGDSIKAVAREFGATSAEVEDLVRVQLTAAWVRHRPKPGVTCPRSSGQLCCGVNAAAAG